MINKVAVLDATKLRDDREGVYKPYVTKNFPKNDRPLPIVSQDFTYTMDLMFITTLDGENTRDMSTREVIDLTKKQKKEREFILKRKYDIRIPSYEGDEEVKPYSCALILIETTSRKTWGYPLRSKKASDVLEAFKQFLKDINNRIAKLLSDCGKEYSEIKKFNMKNQLFHYFQANASQNRHTTLSRVDRVIRTLRGLIREYYSTVEDGNWNVMLSYIINLYNNTEHSSLFLRDPDNNNKKIFYTPEQVWNNPVLRRRIKIKDYLTKYKNYKYSDTFFLPGTEVYYRITSKQLKSINHKGYLSQYPAKIIQRIGNSFQIRLKNSDDKKLDAEEKNTSHYSGPIVIVPERDLVLKENVKKYKSKYNLKGMLNALHEESKSIIPEIEELSADEDEEEEEEQAPPELEEFSEPEEPPPEIEEFSEPEEEPPELEEFSDNEPEVELIKVKQEPVFDPSLVKQEPIYEPLLVKLEELGFNPDLVKMEFNPYIVKQEQPPKKKKKRMTRADREIMNDNWRIFAPEGSKRIPKPKTFY